MSQANEEISPFAAFADEGAAPSPIRPPIRNETAMPQSSPPGGEEDHLERARKRLAELRAEPHDTTGNDVYDALSVQAPPGWSYNWKKAAIYNKDDPAYVAGLQRGGWSFVPASRHMDRLYPGYKGESIIIGGL